MKLSYANTQLDVYKEIIWRFDETIWVYLISLFLKEKIFLRKAIVDWLIGLLVDSA